MFIAKLDVDDYDVSNAHALNDSDVRDVLDDCDVFEVCYGHEVRDVHYECDVCNVLAVIDSDVYDVQDVLDECDVRGISVMPMISVMTVISLMTVHEVEMSMVFDDCDVCEFLED
jgi:hypothetical protein